MAVSPSTAYSWRMADLSLVLLLNALATYSLAYFTLSWHATLALTAWACYCATTGIHSILLLKKVREGDIRGVISLPWFPAPTLCTSSPRASPWTAGAQYHHPLHFPGSPA